MSQSQQPSSRLQSTVPDDGGPDRERPQSSGSESAKSGQKSVILEDNYHTPATQPRTRQRSFVNRPRSPNLRWHKGFEQPEQCRRGRVFMIDYVKQTHSKEGMKKVAAQEFDNIHSLRKLYESADRGREAVLRVLHVQNAPWATPFLLKKFNISDKADLVGTTFGRYVKHKHVEKRGGKPFLSGKSWKTTHDPWRGISRTSFGLDYLWPCKVDRNLPPGSRKQYAAKMMEMNCYDDNDNPMYGYDVYVQRISCYIQKREGVSEVSPSPDIENPYLEAEGNGDPNTYFPRLETLDNESTIIIFENSQSGSVEDTLIQARQQWESRWRRLPFYLAYENHDISTDERMASECMKMIIQDLFKSVAENWNILLDISDNHISILEDKIYEEPADETRAPELWTNSSWWLKIERLIWIHSNLVKEMQLYLHEMSGQGLEDNWLEASTADMERIGDLVQEDLIKPTTSLSDLMYKSVEIRDSRHGLQLNTSMWRLSWITFIFLPLTFIVGFFGMNVDTFQNNPSIKWYFIVAIAMMAVVLLSWYIIKHFLLRRRQSPYSRGIYDQLFHEMATQYPSLWSRSGPRGIIEPTGRLDRVKWRLVLFWNQPQKTTRIGVSDGDAEYDDLGTWARCKRMLTRRWTYQLRSTNKYTADASSLLENAESTELESAIGQVTDVPANPVMEHTDNENQLPGGMQRVNLPLGLRTAQRIIESRRDSAGRPVSAGSSQGRNSGILVEEERPTWLQDLREAKDRHVTEWLGNKRAEAKREGSESRKGSHVPFEHSVTDERNDVTGDGARDDRKENRRASHVSFEPSVGDGELEDVKH